MKKFIFYLLAIVAICGMASCSSDDEPGKIELSKGHSSNVSMYANQTNGEINFTAASSWSAWTSTSSRASDDIDWITLNTTSGSAGEVSLTFTLDYNNTGSSRTAYIIIVCEDEQISIKITQTTEEDENGDEPSTQHPMTNFCQTLAMTFPLYRILDFDGNLFSYGPFIDYAEAVEMITGNQGKCIFSYSDYKTLIAKDSYGRSWKITIGGGVYHNYATHIEYYEQDNLRSTYELEYGGNYLSKFTQYKDGKVYETSVITWYDGDITSVKTTFNGGSTTLVPKYSDVENVCNLMMFDTQLWVDMDDMEIFYFLGFLVTALST